MIHVSLENRHSTLVAVDKEGKEYQINGCVIMKENNTRRIFYDTDDSFFKAAFPSGTVHKAEEIETGVVNLY